MIYHANLERYLDLKHQKDNTIPTVRILPNSEIGNKELALPGEKAQLSDSVIVENIPKTMRTRAVALLNRLKARPDVISWMKRVESALMVWTSPTLIFQI